MLTYEELEEAYREMKKLWPEELARGTRFTSDDHLLEEVVLEFGGPDGKFGTDEFWRRVAGELEKRGGYKGKPRPHLLGKKWKRLKKRRQKLGAGS